MKFLFISILAALILAGCSKQSSITEPQSEVQREWLKLNIHPDQKVEDAVQASKLINGSVGGQLNLKEDFHDANGNIVTVDVDLDIPAGAFGDTTIQISYTVNSDATIDFSPSMTFQKELTLKYKLTGVDLSSYNPDLLDFVYLENNGFGITSYQWKKVDTRRGLLQVFKAKIEHFSRYGWATITDPDPIDPNL